MTVVLWSQSFLPGAITFCDLRGCSVYSVPVLNGQEERHVFLSFPELEPLTDICIG